METYILTRPQATDLVQRMPGKNKTQRKARLDMLVGLWDMAESEKPCILQDGDSYSLSANKDGETRTIAKGLPAPLVKAFIKKTGIKCI